MKKIFLFSAIILACYETCCSQTTVTASQTVTLTLQSVIDISITAAVGTNFSFDNVTEYLNGLTNTNASNFSIKSNRPWNLTVKSATANFTGPIAPAPVMPSTKLGVRLNGGSTYFYLSPTVATLTTGARGVNSFNIDYYANPGFSYDAGTYTISVVYTATIQ